MAKNGFQPKVTIVIPVYNGADFLAEAIDSALAQTYSNFEVLVINDGSTDGGASERVAKSYGDKIRYLSKPNGGVASALNYGFEHMEGEYLSWLSHDDLYTPDKLQYQIESLADMYRGRIILYSDAAIFWGDRSETTPLTLPGIRPEQFRYFITSQSALHGCTLLIPRAVYTECGPLNEKLRTTQDYDYWFRISGRFRFVHQPKTFVFGRQHAEQGSVRMKGIAIAECNALLSRFAQEMTADELTLGSGRSTTVAYAQLAVSMWTRGFMRAGFVCSKLSFSKMASASFKDSGSACVTMLMGMPFYQSLKPFVRLLPNGLKDRIKKVLIEEPSERAAAAPAHVRDFGLKEKFSEVYDKNFFEGGESRSGEGSDLIQTEVIRQNLPKLVSELGVQTFLDAPCGDWNWMKECRLGVKEYVGVDIVPKIIEQNRQKFGSDSTRFECLDIASDRLPRADLVLSRDCLEHLSFRDAFRVIENIKKTGAKYLVTTTFTEREKNFDLNESVWRPLNKQLPPFNFPAPVRLINERCTEGDGNFGDKCLGVWNLADIHLENTNLATF